MKKIILFSIVLAVHTALLAQSAEQGNQQLYYERNHSAEITFHQVLKTNPDNALAWYDLTKAYLLQGKLNSAKDSLQLAPSSVQQDPYYKVANGAVLLQENNKEEANNYFNDALKETKEKNAGILSAVAAAHILADSGDANYAIELLSKSIKKEKHNAAFYVQLGDAWRKLVNASEAYKAYHKAIEENNKYAIAYHRMGEIFLSQKNTELYLDYFKKAVAADARYAPSLYKLYVYEFNREPAKAMKYYKDYIENADLSIQNEYDMADLFYLTKQYDMAIEKAKQIVDKQGPETKPRIYKLIGYSYAAAGDTTQAISFMQQYFSNEEDSNFISKDYETIAELYASLDGKQDSADGKKDSAIAYYQKAVQLEKDQAALYRDYEKLADLAKAVKDYPAQAVWLGNYYTGNDKASNLDLFNWGLAHYRAENYIMADSVFGIYAAKYPEQSFGYYWQARSKSQVDTGMKTGLAVPAYQALVEVLQKDTANASYKKWMIEAYGYLAAYAANIEKDYKEAIDYFEQILDIDPENESAKKYVAILEKDLASSDK